MKTWLVSKSVISNSPYLLLSTSRNDKHKNDNFKIRCNMILLLKLSLKVIGLQSPFDTDTQHIKILWIHMLENVELGKKRKILVTNKLYCFVSKIVLTFCILKGREFSNFLKSLQQFMQTVQYNFWKSAFWTCYWGFVRSDTSYEL